MFSNSSYVFESVVTSFYLAIKLLSKGFRVFKAPASGPFLPTDPPNLLPLYPKFFWGIQKFF